MNRLLKWGVIVVSLFLLFTIPVFGLKSKSDEPGSYDVPVEFESNETFSDEPIYSVGGGGGGVPSFIPNICGDGNCDVKVNEDYLSCPEDCKSSPFNNKYVILGFGGLVIWYVFFNKKKPSPTDFMGPIDEPTNPVEREYYHKQKEEKERFCSYYEEDMQKIKDRIAFMEDELGKQTRNKEAFHYIKK